MLQALSYAQKLNEFLASLDKQKLHYKITVQLDFSIDVYLYIEDPDSMNREKLKGEYLNWLHDRAQNRYLNDNTGEIIDGLDKFCNDECEADFKIYFDYGDVKFYIKTIDDIGDPGENGSGIHYGPRYRLSSLIQPGANKRIDLPPVVTFYSYKGGMGRTTTLMGFALWLANKGKKVAIIDCDLEAPGYLNFFNLGEQKQFVDGNKNGFVEFMGDSSFMRKFNTVNNSDSDNEDDKPFDIKNYIVIPTAPDDNQEAGRIYDNIYIVPGGNLNDAFIDIIGEEDDESEFRSEQWEKAIINRSHYIEGLSRINLSNPNVLKSNFEKLIQLLKDTYKIDIVLIDSRTGFNDIYGSTAFDLSDHIVAFFGFSKQTIPGLRQLLDTYAKFGKRLGLTLCNSILPAKTLIDKDKRLYEKWKKFSDDFSRQVRNQVRNINETIPIPDTVPIHRRQELEELGMDSQADLNFLSMIINNESEDYMKLFRSLYDSLLKSFPEEAPVIESAEKVKQHDLDRDILKSTKDKNPLRLSKIILRELKSKLEKVQNFAEVMEEPRRSTFLYRECMRFIFEPKKFIVRGFKGSGKTCMYRALGNDEVASFIQKRALGSSSSAGKYIFINVINFEGISDHPLKLLEENGILQDNKFYNINALWQFMMWNAIFADKRFEHLLEKSQLKEHRVFVSEIGGANALKRINKLIEQDALAMLSSIDEDMRRLDQYLEGNQQELFVMYDGLDNVVKPKYWSKAISPLINKWGGNLAAYNHIHPKIFVRTDLFERIEGTNTERLKANVIDIDWSIEEVFGYLFKLILGEDQNESRLAMWDFFKKQRPESAEATIENMNRAIKNGHGQFPTFDPQTLKLLVELFFGKEVTVKGARLGPTWDYFKKQLSNAAGKISLRLFINTLTKDVLSKGLENSNKNLKEVISSEIYASRETRTKAADSYFNDMASEEDFTDDLKKVKDFIHDERGLKYRKKTLSEVEFNEMLIDMFDIYRNAFRSVETVREFAQLIYASGLMKEVYKPGRKIYIFAPMFEYAWGLSGKSEDEETNQTRIKPNNHNQFQKRTVEKEFEGVLLKESDRLYVTQGPKKYKCMLPYPDKKLIGKRVRCIIKCNKQGSFPLATNVIPIE